LSKETKGKVVTKLEDVSPTGPQRIGLVGAFVVVPLFFYAGIYGIDHFATSSKSASAPVSDQSSAIESQGWKIPRFYERASEVLLKSFSEGKIAVVISPALRKGEWVTVPMKISNSTDKVIKARVSMLTAASASKLKSYELSTGEVIVTPGHSEERSIRVIVPVNASNESERSIYVEGFIQNMDGDSLSIKTVIVLK
jgi:hypothetical protein